MSGRFTYHEAEFAGRTDWKTKLKLEGNGAIVTGAGSGMGEAIARSLADEGAEVVTVGRTIAKLEQAKISAGAAGTRFHPYAADVADPDAVRDLYAWARTRLPQTDILVNNAGINVPERMFADVKRKDFDYIVRVNLNGVFYLMQAVLPEMRERGSGVVITISSIAGVRSDMIPGPAYNASKHGARALSLSAHLEEGGNGIRCCLIHPGGTNTPIMDSRPNPPSAERRAKMLQSEDIAQAVLFVATLHPRANVPELVMVPTGQPYS